MIEEPEIVKQLREEESEGKLQYKNFDLKFKIFEKIGFKKKELQKNKTDVKISSYEDALDLAKKVLNELNNDF